MPDVAGGWLCSLLGTLGGIWGGKLYILEHLPRVPAVRVPNWESGASWPCFSILLLGALGLVFHRKKYVYD